MLRTITEKILAAHALEGEVAPGAIATIRPDVVLLNDVSGPLAFTQFAAMGATRVFDPERVVLVADHFAPAKDVESAEQLRLTARFAERYGLRHHYGPGRGGIEHTLIAELGLVGHGDIVFGADSHTCTAGAFNALGIGFGSSDLAAALATVTTPAWPGRASPRQRAPISARRGGISIAAHRPRPHRARAAGGTRRRPRAA